MNPGNALIITNRRWNSGEKWFAFQLANSLRNQKWEIYFITADRGSPLETATNNGYPVWRNINPNSNNPFKVIKDYWSFKKNIKKHKITHIFSFCGIGHLWMSHCSNVKRIQVRMEARSAKKHLISKYLYQKKCDLVILPSEKAIKEQKNGAGIPKNGCYKTSGYADLIKFNPNIKKADNLDLNQSHIIIGLIGRLAEVKGQTTAIEAIKLLNAKNIKCTLLCVGQDTNINQKQLIKFAEKNNCIDQLILTGRREDIPAIMQACDIGIVPSKNSEYTVRTSLEWLASGKPLITSNVGTLPETIEKSYGLTIDPNDSVKLANAIEQLLPYKEEMGTKAREKAEMFYSEKYFFKNLVRTLEGLK